jgi:hypothetical protein
MVNPIRLALKARPSTYRTSARSTGIPEWTWQDFAHAAGSSGCSDLEMSAMEYRWTGADRVRGTLYGALMLEALKAEKRHGWSERIAGHRYIDAMVQLALHVESTPALAELPNFWQTHMEWMLPARWKKEGKARYEVIRLPLDIWVDAAMRKCSRVLRERDF